MQNNTIILGGMERSFMRKLALYLTERLEGRIQVGISENPKAVSGEYDLLSTMWIGSEHFLQGLDPGVPEQNRITFCREMREDEQHIFQYQSREKLYGEICRRCRWENGGAGNGGRQKWMALTCDGSAGALLAASMVCARILAEKNRVLFLNLSACSGMKQLFRLEQERDLGDLLFELRKHAGHTEAVALEPYVGRLEQVDYILPVRNPMILQELQERDLEHLLSAVQKCERYDWVVFAVGTVLCGCRQIFSGAALSLHLTGKGLLAESSGREWTDFLQQSAGPRGKDPEIIGLPSWEADHYGPHLIRQWLESAAGQCLEEKLTQMEGGRSS